jgi:carbonic anhydrase/acetyltransferase-like protein (isoleucine patch superfamily)
LFQRKDTYTIPEGYREEFVQNWKCLGYRGKIDAHPECYLSPDCRISGAVSLGYHAAVYAGSQLRADSDRIEIGAESNVQENCIIHESNGLPVIIGEHSSIGHGAILHGCTIGDNALVGMGAIVMDGARVGNNAVVAAGAVVVEDVPENAVVAGVPARIIKYKDEKTASKTALVDALRTL